MEYFENAPRVHFGKSANLSFQLFPTRFTSDPHQISCAL